MARIFVFGSNLAGRHGAGAAKFARENHGAIYGQGVGIQGNSYAIPTKDENLEVLPLSSIKVFVKEFLLYAKSRENDVFNVTRVGCGLAGYKDEQMAALFKGFSGNVLLPDRWKDIIDSVDMPAKVSDKARGTGESRQLKPRAKGAGKHKFASEELKCLCGMSYFDYQREPKPCKRVD